MDVSFHRNRARLGAVVFFNGFPSCRVPVTESNLWNASQASAWSWSDFGASVTGNIATLGNLQATSPATWRKSKAFSTIFLSVPQETFFKVLFLVFSVMFL